MKGESIPLQPDRSAIETSAHKAMKSGDSSGPSAANDTFARRLGQRAIELYLDFPYLAFALMRRLGWRSLAEQFLGGMYDSYPFDYTLAMRLGDFRYHNRKDDYPFGSVERSRCLLKTMGRSFPTDLLSGAYFANLERILQAEAPRAQAGQIVLGMGTGRSGSTTLAGILALIEGSKVTHENPPLIFWEPHPRQIGFHLKRFEILARHYDFVADCSHWWLNVSDQFLERFSNGKIIGAYRDVDATAKSFMKVSSQPRDHNHWVMPHNGVWPCDRWSPTYPQYPMPEDARRNRDQVKFALIKRYVSEYNARLHQMAAQMPKRVLLLRTEELDDAATRQKISEFVDRPIANSAVRLNVGTIAHSAEGGEAFWF